jgi:hypothetical protein
VIGAGEEPVETVVGLPSGTAGTAPQRRADPTLSAAVAILPSDAPR